MMLIYTIVALENYVKAYYIESVRLSKGTDWLAKELLKDKIYIVKIGLITLTVKYYGVTINIRCF